MSRGLAGSDEVFGVRAWARGKHQAHGDRASLPQSSDVCGWSVHQMIGRGRTQRHGQGGAALARKLVGVDLEAEAQVARALEDAARLVQVESNYPEACASKLDRQRQSHIAEAYDAYDCAPLV